MKAKVAVVVVLAVCAVGAYRKMTARASPLERVMEVPSSFGSGSRGGISYAIPGPALRNYCEPGRTTVFAFTSDRCPGCRQLKTLFGALTGLRPDVAVRIVDLGDNWSGDYRTMYGINLRSVPHVMIYDDAGELVAGDDGGDKAGLDLLCEWMNAEVRRRAQRRGPGGG